MNGLVKILALLLTVLILTRGAEANTVSVGAGSTSISLQNYSTLSGMCNDANGTSFDLGCVSSGGNVVYSLNVASAGSYGLTVNYSSPAGNTGVNILVNGATVGTVNFSSTGGSWSSYTNAPVILIGLPAGAVTLEVQARASGFNIGGLTLASSITSIGATGTSAVPLQTYSAISGMCNDSNGTAFDLGCVSNGAYVVFPISVAQAGTYSLTVSYASPVGNTAVNVLVNGVNVASVSFSATNGSWSTYVNAAPATITLPAGSVNLEIQAQSPGFNLGALSLTRSSSASSPVSTISVPLPSYTAIAGMCGDANGVAFDLGCVQAGGYVTYSVTVSQAGNYALTLNYSSPTGSAGVNVLVNGTSAGNISFSPTGSWSNYANAAPLTVTLPAGTVPLQLRAAAAGFNLDGVSLSYSGPSLGNSTPGPSTVSIPILVQSYSALSGMCLENNGIAFDLGCAVAGGYAVYPVQVPQAGSYALSFQYASQAGNGAVNVLVNGVAAGSASGFASTGAWSSYAYSQPTVVALPAGTVSLEIQVQQPGINIGALNLFSSQGTYQLGTFGSSANQLAAIFATPNASAIPASYFGLSILNLAGTTTAGGTAGATPFPSFPIQTLRLWDVAYWQEMEPSQGQYNWTTMDSTISAAKKSGVGDFVFTLGRVPTWASSNPYDFGCSDGGGSCDFPNTSAFTDFFTNVVQRYCGVVKYYESWNEPDNVGYWNGTNAQLLNVVSDAYQIAKNPANCGCQNGVCSPGGGTNPNQMLLPPISALGQQSLNWLGSYLTAAGSTYSYADIAAFHGYVSGPPEQIIPGVGGFERVIAAHGLGNLPVWNTEIDWGPRASAVAQTQEASWLMRSYITQATTGAPKYIWYAYDSCPWGTLWGPSCDSSGNRLDSWTGTRAAGQAYGVLENWLVGRTLDHCEAYQNGLWACELEGPVGYVGWAVWSSGANSSLSVPPAMGLTDYRDWQNNMYPLPATVPVSSLPVLIEN